MKNKNYIVIYSIYYKILKVNILKKILMVGVVLLAICVSISAVSADDGWSFNFSSSEGSNSDGGSVSFDNGKLVLQDIEFAIPDGYKENDTAQKLAEQAEDDEDAKYSLCSFLNGDKEIVVKVFFSDDFDYKNLTAADGFEDKTVAGHDGIYNENAYGDNTPTFKFIEKGKLVEVNAPDDETLESVIK